MFYVLNMEKHHVITLLGKPISKKRPRFRRFNSTYDPQSEEKKATKLKLISSWPFDLIEGAVFIDIKFFLPFPKSWSKKKKENFENIYHTVKFDIDNMIKYYFDCMNGTIFLDDKQVVELHSSKYYTDSDGYTTIMIKAFENDI